MKKYFMVLFGTILLLCTSACGILREEKVKIEDLSFTVLGEEMIPGELAALIEEKKALPFRFTYTDREYLYIVAGYGERATPGYRIVVDELYLAEDGVYVSTQLLGPGPEDKEHAAISYPYIVIKTKYLDETVIFE